ncbi:MAG: hypothetical protein RLN89_04285 [Parvibaculum sp.]
MKKKLTEMSVSKIAPEVGRRLEVFETPTPGLALRITERGKKSWSVMYRVAGRGSGGIGQWLESCHTARPASVAPIGR